MIEVDERFVLTVDPRRQFGAVCVAGTRIPAESLGGQVAAGDSVDEVAADFEVHRDTVLLACWWYANECAGDRRVWPKRVSAAWDDWAFRAGQILGGHIPGPLQDPPDVPPPEKRTTR